MILSLNVHRRARSFERPGPGLKFLMSFLNCLFTICIRFTRDQNAVPTVYKVIRDGWNLHAPSFERDRKRREAVDREGEVKTRSFHILARGRSLEVVPVVVRYAAYVDERRHCRSTPKLDQVFNKHKTEIICESLGLTCTSDQ